MDSRLSKAARDGNLNLLEEIANGDAKDMLLSTTPQKNTALHLAVVGGRREFAEAILGKCSSLLEKGNAQGDSALHSAARAGNLSIAMLLTNQYLQLKNGSGKEDEEAQCTLERMRNSKGNTALHEALINGYAEVALHLLEVDHGLAEIVNKAGESPLYLAARRGLKEVVEKILSSITSFSQDGPNGQTPLHAAVMGNFSGTVEFLVGEMPGLITSKDSSGNTALHYATERKLIDEIKLLLTENYTLGYAINNVGRSPLLIAVHVGCSLAVGMILEHCPDSAELLDEEGRNALHIAVSSNDYKTVKQLLKNPLVKSLINGRDKDGNTPLHLANKKDFISVECLLSDVEGVDLMASNKEGFIASSWRYSALWPRLGFLHSVLKVIRVMNYLGLPLIDSYADWKDFAEKLWRFNALLIILVFIFGIYVKPDITIDAGTPLSADYLITLTTIKIALVGFAMLPAYPFILAMGILVWGVRGDPKHLRPAIRNSWIFLWFGLWLLLPASFAVLPAEKIFTSLLPTMLAEPAASFIAMD